ncbi:cytochrome P450 [Mycolicibacterium fluoranthenivorans]|uniref:Cytochrome P450 n=1 Tax=Mycolicibacterium fluoranthenivorans TaxID=258505 RepID=A0A1G4WWW8_9MYCO|nr:cytochrome P450 [Mycolicibacterium fluoranthenivorans]QNJ94772.1 cytochrome P450 [Mycolicibacterium fluoranthenivorans]SCX31312.1 Cytochrome P450 [Mycolicibacterium fluoranthenivorans]
MNPTTPPHVGPASAESATTPDQAELLPFYHQELLDEPYAHFRRLREEFPALKLEDGTYVISRYDDVSTLLRHTKSSVQQLDFGAFDILHSSVMGMDAPEHTRHKRFVNKVFTPKSVRSWMTTTAAVVERALSAAEPTGQIEAVRDLCLFPIHATTCSMLGVPAEYADEVRYYTYQFARGFGLVPTEEDMRAGAEGSAWLENYCTEVIERAAREPQPGVIADYLEAEERGEMTRRETTANMLLFVAAGEFSPTNLTAHALERMALDPELFAVFREDPAVRPKVINELLRFVTPEVGVTRMVLEDVEVAGTVIPAGSTVYVLLSSANRDERAFPDPDRFDYSRSTEGRQNLAFAGGLHSCMGQALARQEAETILTAVTERCARIELIGEPEYNSIQHARQWKTVNLGLTF